MEYIPYIHKCQYYETDKMGIIHHSNYIRWFEEARVDFMEQMGFGYEKMEESGIVSPVLSVSCRFCSMTGFGDSVQIVPVIQEYTGTRLSLSYTVSDAKSGQLRAEGTSQHCFLSASSQRPISLKKMFPEIHQRFLDAFGK